MTDEQKQHLTQLIKTSPILNAQEREEWLMLLELMNDKQVGELERILAPAPAVVPKPAPARPVAPASLPMKHIVNMPKAAPTAPTAQAKPDKTFSKFAEHLNQILAEKDLPVGEKAPLDLPKGEAKVSAPVAPKPVPPQPQPQQQPKSSIYDIMPVVVEQPIYLKKTLPPKMASASSEDSDSFVQSPEVSGKIINKILDSEKRTLPTVNEPEPAMADLTDIESLKIKPKGTPGLQNNSQLFQSAVMRPATSASAEVASQPAELSPEIKLEEPADAAELTLSGWRQENPLAFINRLKKIVAKRGYYEVIFNLQKSPLYSAYIDSGLKSLAAAAGQNFEALGENYMSKKQFEDFTDLLRELQV